MKHPALTVYQKRVAKLTKQAEPEWPSGLQRRTWCMRQGRSWVWAPVWPKPPPMLADMSVITWIETAQLPCWPLYSQQVSHQRWIWGSHKQENMQGIHPGFETQGRHHQKSKTGVSVAPQKGLMSSKNFLKNCQATPILQKCYFIPLGNDKLSLSSWTSDQALKICKVPFYPLPLPQKMESGHCQ